MIETTPKIYLICEPAIIGESMQAYLKEVKGQSWYERIAVPEQLKLGKMGAQELIEFAGRLCYRSWEPGLNKNVTKIRKDRHDYFNNLLASGHGSVLEHANLTFIFHNVSRVFTHELVRHRAGVAISQESLRYVRLTDIGFRIPAVLERMRERVIEVVETLEEFQLHATNALGLDNEGDEWQGDPKSVKDILTFAEKKEITSAMRRLAPLGLSTGMVWTANVRTIRHVLATRTAEGAEEEIRLVFHEVGKIVKERYPFLFSDFEQQPVKDPKVAPAWVPKHPVAGTVRVADA